MGLEAPAPNSQQKPVALYLLSLAGIFSGVSATHPSPSTSFSAHAPHCLGTMQLWTCVFQGPL